MHNALNKWYGYNEDKNWNNYTYTYDDFISKERLLEKENKRR